MWGNVADDLNELTADRTPPSIDTWSHGSGEVVAGDVTFWVTASDDFSIEDVVFCHGYGQPDQSMTTPGTLNGDRWEFLLDTSTVDHHPALWIGAKALDSADPPNESDWSYIHVVVDNRDPGSIPTLSVTPSHIDFGTVTPDDEITQSVTLVATGYGTLNWTASHSGQMDLSFPSSGTIVVEDEEEHVPFIVTVDTTDLEWGSSHTEPLYINSPGGNVTIACHVTIREADMPPDEPSADKDVTVHWSYTGGSIENSSVLEVGMPSSTENDWAVLHFDVSHLEGMVIEDAVLHMFLEDGGAGVPLFLSINRVNFPWGEGTPYQTFETGSYTLFQDCSTTVWGGSDYWVTWPSGSDNMKNLVQQWVNNPSINYGIAVFQNGIGSLDTKTFSSSEGAESPRLMIAFAPFADEEGPVISVESHADGQHVSQSVITVSGTAYDLSGVDWVRVNGDYAGDEVWSDVVELVEGANTITVTARDLSFDSHESSYQFTIYYDQPDFELSVIPELLSVVQGDSDSASVHLVSVDGFAAPVDLVVAGLPSGVSVEIVPNPVVPTGNASLTANIAETASPGTHTLTVEGTGGGRQHSDTIDLVVQQRPSVTITSPPADEVVVFEQTTFAFAGTASDDDSVVLVEYRILGSDWEPASGTTSWSFEAAGLEVGPNLIQVRSSDSDGLTSAVDERVITRSPEIPLEILTDVDSVEIPEGGTGGFEVKLSAAPDVPLTVEVSWLSGDDDISVSPDPTLLDFDDQNWDVYQPVTLLAAEDGDTANGEAIIQCSAPDLEIRTVTTHEHDTDTDCNGNGIPDDLEIADCDGSPECSDCNGNGLPDECDVADGTSEDCNTNGIPDVCELDGDADGLIDDCDPCPLDPPAWQPGDPVAGVEWSARAMTKWDPDGAGPASSLLILGGDFEVAGDVIAHKIAAWDGTSWHALGSGMNGTVYALAVYDGDLIAGGNFTVAGGASCNYIARWDGVAWQPVEDGLNGMVLALTVYNEELYVGGEFTAAGSTSCNYAARWNSDLWQPVGGGLNNVVDALTVYNESVVVGGDFTLAGAVPCERVARWDGGSWHALGSGLDAQVRTLTVCDTELIAAGNFTMAGGSSRSVARWDGVSWQPLGTGMDGPVLTLTVYNDNLIAGGHFTTAGGVAANYVARWESNAWQPLGDGLEQTPWALTVYNGELYAAGHFRTAGDAVCHHIARWDDASWRPVGDGSDHEVWAVTVYDEELVAGGRFTTMGGVSCNYIARWDGTSWQPLGEGMNDVVRALTIYNGDLVAAGSFTTAGGIACNRIARWDGTSWHPMGTGMEDIVIALTVYNEELIAGGLFTSADGAACGRIARWDGTAWLPLGTGVDDQVHGLTVFNGELVAGGLFMNAGSATNCNRIARWDGMSWHTLGDGMNHQVRELTVYDGELVATGIFTAAGGVPCNYIARWDGVSWHALDTGLDRWALALTVYNNELVVGGHFVMAGGVDCSHIARWDGTSWHPFGDGVNRTVLALTAHGADLIAGGQFGSAGGHVSAFVARWGQYCPMNDCNNNGIPDEDDLANCDGSPWCSDCNGNEILDECEAIENGDFDADGVADMADWGAFVDGMAGPDTPPLSTSPACVGVYLAAFDLDEDEDIDLRDFCYFQQVFTGDQP